LSLSLEIRQLGVEDWRVFRNVRLAALKEAPYAFGSTFEREVGASNESWRNRLTDRTRFVAEMDGQVAGTVGAGPGEFTGAAALTALWVGPRFRGQGVGSKLVEAVVDWARDQGLAQVLLWVADVNQNAERLYVRHGFARTGRVSEIRPGEPAVEYKMTKRI
jgi:GNAT superfamily N-acetyltransferase